MREILPRRPPCAFMPFFLGKAANLSVTVEILTRLFAYLIP